MRETKPHNWDWGCNSVVDYIPCMCKTLGSVGGRKGRKRKKKRMKGMGGGIGEGRAHDRETEYHLQLCPGCATKESLVREV